MTTLGKADAAARHAQVLVLWIDRALEALWLLAVLLVPLVFLGRNFGEWSSVIGSYELPKIVLLRSLVGLMAALWLLKWAVQSGSADRSIPVPFTPFQPRIWLSKSVNWLRDDPARWVIVAAAVFLGSYLISTVLSASVAVSLWGDVPGQDSYSAYTVTAYVVLFAVIVAHLKSSAQLWRLFGAIALMGFIFAAYAGSQHYGYDFLELREPLSTTRATSTLGNALFAGTLLALTIPVTLGFAASTLKDTLKSTGFWAKVGFWSTVLAVQLLGLVFTFSRGPLFATFGTLATFIVLVALFVGWRQLVRVSVVLALAGALALVVVSLPIPIHRVNDESVAASRVSTSVATTSRSRLTSISGSTGGGVNGGVKVGRVGGRLLSIGD